MNYPPPPPAISVILTLYNRPQFMAAAIDSVLNQTLRDFELLLINDGSTNPQVAEIARQYERQDARVRYFIKKHSGVSDTRNVAVENSRAEIIAFRDDDDISEPHCLQTQFDYLQNHADIAAVICRCAIIDAHGKVFGKQSKTKRGQVNLVTNVMMIRRPVFLAVGGFRPWFKAAGDNDFTLRFAEANYLSRRLPQILLRYRWHSTNLSRNRQSLRYESAAYYSAYCRTHGKPEPITADATLETVMQQLKTADWRFRLGLLWRARYIVKYWIMRALMQVTLS